MICLGVLWATVKSWDTDPAPSSYILFRGLTSWLLWTVWFMCCQIVLFLFACVWDKFSICCPGWLLTHSPSALACRGSGLQACISTPGSGRKYWLWTFTLWGVLALTVVYKVTLTVDTSKEKVIWFVVFFFFFYLFTLFAIALGKWQEDTWPQLSHGCLVMGRNMISLEKSQDWSQRNQATPNNGVVQ